MILQAIAFTFDVDNLGMMNESVCNDRVRASLLNTSDLREIGKLLVTTMLFCS